MTLFLSILTNNTLPVYLVVAFGVLLERKLHIDKRTLSRLAIYLLSPSLVFSSLMATEVKLGEMGLILLSVFLVMLAMIGMALGVARLLGWSSKKADGLVLSTAFLNAGNLGLSVALFAFGEAGLELATIYFVGTNLAVNTFGAFFAARGNGGAKKALGKLLRLPGIYAFALAIILRSLQIDLPGIVMKPINLIAQATVPIMLIMLGVQLSQTRVVGRLKDVSIAVALRLVGGAAVAFLISPLLGFEGLVRQVVIMESATPTAVNSSLMAIEFDADPEFVSSSIFVSTVLSSVTLSVLLAILA